MVKGDARSAPYFDVAVEVARAISRLDSESWPFDYRSNKVTYFICGRKHR